MVPTSMHLDVCVLRACVHVGISPPGIGLLPCVTHLARWTPNPFAMDHDDEQRGNSRITTGGPLLGAAKLYFLLAAYVTTLVLARVIDASTLGQYNVVARLIAVPNMVIVQTVMFAVSRPMAGQYDDGTPSYTALRRRGTRIALVLGGGASFVFFLAAPVLGEVLNDTDLVAPIRYVAPISAVYGLYAVNIGTLNATRRFTWQAALDIFMATSKAGLIIVGASLGLGLAMTIGGFTVAAALSLCLSVVFVWFNRPQKVVRPSAQAPPMAAFAGVLILFTLGMNLLLLVDLFVLKKYAVTDAQNHAVGLYSSAQLVALIPYSLMNAVSLVMFPLIATLSASKDTERIRRYVTETAKVTILLLALMAAVASASAYEIQELLFPAEYAAGASDLGLLVWGYSGYSFAVTSAWILNSSGRSKVAIGLVTVVLVTVATLTLLWVPEQGNRGAAMAVVVAGGVGVVVAFAALRGVFGARAPLPYLVKIVAATIAVVLLGQLWSAHGFVMIVAKLAAMTVVFVGIIWGSRAVTVAQLKELRRAG